MRIQSYESLSQCIDITFQVLTLVLDNIES